MGVTPGVVTDGEGTWPVVKVRSTQYWLACQVLVGKALLEPYAYTPTSVAGIDRFREAEVPVNCSVDMYRPTEVWYDTT